MSNVFPYTPNPPYYAVIFTSPLTDKPAGYSEMTTQMEEFAKQQKCFLGMESARENIGVTISYWSDLESIRAWKANTDHLFAQQQGKEKWYSRYKVRISKVERDYSFQL